MNLDSLFRFEFLNGNPVELEDFAESMMALSDEYRRFTLENGEITGGDTQARLYIKEIRTGSVIADLVPWVAASLPLYENFNTIVQFGQNIGLIMRWLLDGDSNSLAPEGMKEIDKTSIENVCTLIEPVAKDVGGQLNLSTVIHGNVTVNIHINTRDANAIQNNGRRRLKKEPPKVTGRHEKVVMYWHQTKADPQKCTGDKSIIESLSKKAVKTEAPPDIKSELMARPNNPFKRAYIVDVEVETVMNEPVLYKVTRFHDTIPLGGTEEEKDG